MSQSQSLKVIALISGGKDSLYSILHCLRNGHEVVALGNLHPPSPTSSVKGAEERTGTGKADFVGEEGDDIDSFMYQTIGHSIVPLYEEALGIPLYRRAITGRAVNAEREYSNVNPDATGEGEGEDGEDETESLFYLLRDIMKEHPTANAVSAGAILSTYQRTRIENVAGRLGLTPLAWLWMYPYLPPPVERAHDPSSAVTGLLDDMAAVGCEARVIKVASAGLDSADVLWGDLAGKDGRVRRTLVRIMGRFLTEGVEAAVLGEGGEYESLALDGPGFLWKKRIELGETRTVVAEGGVASLRFKGAKCVEKESDGSEVVQPSHFRRPETFDAEFHALMEQSLKSGEDWTIEEHNTALLDPMNPTGSNWSLCMCQSRGDNAWYISNCCSRDDGSDTVNQMEGIARKLRGILRSKDASADDIVFSTILLRSMSDFKGVNKVYASLFKKPNPPARVTVACGDALPEGVNVAVSIVIDEGSPMRRNGLHVQSRSYWAPANIGPYSQAVSVPLKKDSSLESDGGLVYIAGQIPLDPSTTDLYATERSGIDSFADHAALSLQHLWRVGRAIEMDWWLGGIAFLSGKENISAKTRMAASIWRIANTEPITDSEDDEDCVVDAWDIKYDRQFGAAKCAKIEKRPLPRFNVLGLNCASRSSIPPFFSVQVDELPRDAEIEWQGLGARSSDVNLSHEDVGDFWIAHTQGSGFDSFMYIGIKAHNDIDVQDALRNALSFAKQKRTPGHGQMTTIVYTPYPIFDMTGFGQIVPCRSVRDSNGKELLAGITVHIRP